MREILFRGKRIDNEEWVEGYYYKAKYYRTDKELCDYITVPHPDEKNRGSEHFMVFPETVGQYTGLADKNGKKIFEGDIVKHYNNSDDGFDVGALYWDETFSQWKRTSIGNFHHSSFTYVMSRSCEYEVIGNIHDNPELLKEGVRNA